MEDEVLQFICWVTGHDEDTIHKMWNDYFSSPKKGVTIDNAHKEDEFEFRQHWTSVSSAVSERNAIVNFIMKQAGQLFVENKEDMAHKFRMLANQIKSDGLDNENELQKCIKIAMKPKERKLI